MWVPSLVLPPGVGGWAKKLLQPKFGPLNIVEYIHQDVYLNICECLLNPIHCEFLPKVFLDEKPIHLKSLASKTMYKKSYIEKGVSPKEEKIFHRVLLSRFQRPQGFFKAEHLTITTDGNKFHLFYFRESMLLLPQ